MKKLLILLLILLFPLTTYAYWLCSSAEYVVIEYNNSKKIIKSWWIYDIFLLDWFNFTKKEKINILWNHTNNSFESCKYKGFEKIEKLNFDDLKHNDILNLTINISLFLIILLWILYLFFKYLWKKGLFVIIFIIFWLILFSYIYILLNN